MFSRHVTILFLPALGKDEVYYSSYFFSNICHVDSDDGCISPHSSQYLNDKSLLTRTCLMNANEGGVKGRKGSEQDEKERRKGGKERIAKHPCSMMCPCGD